MRDAFLQKRNLAASQSGSVNVLEKVSKEVGATHRVRLRVPQRPFKDSRFLYLP